MSDYCAKCGTELPTGAIFCPSCGTSISGPAINPAEAQPSGFQPRGYQPSYTQPDYQRPSHEAGAYVGGGYAGAGYARPQHSAVGLSPFAAMVLPLKRYADFEGRSTRVEYWMFTLLYWVVLIASSGMIVAGMPPESQPNQDPDGIAITGMLIFFFWWLGTLIPCIALTVRRLHDQDKPGTLAILFYVLSFLFSFIGWIVQTIFMLLDGTPGANQYGPDPYARDAGQVFA